MFTIKRDYTFGSHIFIELCAPPSEKQRGVNNFDVTLTLSTIPLRVSLKNLLFTFRGVVSFILPLSTKNDAIGHYVNYSWREHINTWERYDICKKPQER